jgi:hypothetical protein
MPVARNRTDRINKIDRIKHNAPAPMKTHPVNPVHPVNGFGVNEIIGKFSSAGQLRAALNQL